MGGGTYKVLPVDIHLRLLCASSIEMTRAAKSTVSVESSSTLSAMFSVWIVCSFCEVMAAGDFFSCSFSARVFSTTFFSNRIVFSSSFGLRPLSPT